jgi:hypothetical protein
MIDEALELDIPLISGKTVKGGLSWAKHNCKDCHGTGIYGVKLEGEGKKTILICTCIHREAERRAKIPGGVFIP